MVNHVGGLEMQRQKHWDSVEKHPPPQKKKKNGAGHINWSLFKVDALCYTQVVALLKSKSEQPTFRRIWLQMMF